MKHLFLVSSLGLALAACGGAEEASDETMAHGGMDHGTTGHGATEHDEAQDTLAPLPDDGILPVVDVRAAWMRPHPQGRDVTAAYFAARLTEGHADRLLSARIDGADRVELHGHTMDDQGMMRMRAIGPQDMVDAGPLVFTPGGRHLMVFGLAAVSEGESVSGVLVFERAGDVPVTFAVRSMPPASPTEY